ncbi:MAG: UDP-N-acetylmuramoyl-tripeptide--D-alanyl-D-alanine ligase [Bryobacterales bacterium]|nr:UDP-N-acetylmuramoyl-tripeptide--D-alanyl-D-alanine ligase [Bryobacterales bacterium]
MGIGVVAVQLLAVVAAALLASRRAVRALHMWQMDSYINARYVQWLFAKPLERHYDVVAIALVAVWIAARFAIGPAGAAAVCVPWIGWALRQWFKKDTEPAKKPLDMTERAKKTLLVARLLIAALAVLFGGTVLFADAGMPLAALLAHMGPWTVLLANTLLAPWRKAVNQRFIRQAGEKLQQLRPVVIGVAGSYGKTSTKYFLDVMLRERHNVLKSPGNFNTLLGITRVVNDMLQPEHKLLIAEMGAYKRGEVKEIADLVHPRIGIITSIGPEHFERFLSMENIEATNYEVIEALPPDGLGVFNGENEHCVKLARATKHTRVALYGLARRDDLDLWAENVEHTSQGLQFELVLKDGRRATVTTAIVGRHNVLNILGAARIALEMEVPLASIVSAIGALQPAPHRLEVKQGGGGTIIIDDSYNSNPIGAGEALHVLSQFKTGRRILVTPGMIELGVLHYQENEKLGFTASECADFVILVGPEQTKPLQDGLKRGNFPEESLRVVKDLSEATAIFQKLLRPGDVLLFENDLPDLYTEK